MLPCCIELHVSRDQTALFPVPTIIYFQAPTPFAFSIETFMDTNEELRSGSRVSGYHAIRAGYDFPDRASLDALIDKPELSHNTLRACFYDHLDLGELRPVTALELAYKDYIRALNISYNQLDRMLTNIRVRLRDVAVPAPDEHGVDRLPLERIYPHGQHLLAGFEYNMRLWHIETSEENLSLFMPVIQSLKDTYPYHFGVASESNGTSVIENNLLRPLPTRDQRERLAKTFVYLSANLMQIDSRFRLFGTEIRISDDELRRLYPKLVRRSVGRLESWVDDQLKWDTKRTRGRRGLQ